jgi:hypothetical protein
MEHLSGLHSEGRIMALPTNARLGWEGLIVTNTLAYYCTEFVTAIKLFITQASVSCTLAYYSLQTMEEDQP